jgi:hypothetical protein
VEAVATPRNRGVNYRRFHSQPRSMSVVVTLRQQSAMGPREDPSASVTFSSLGLKGTAPEPSICLRASCHRLRHDLLFQFRRALQG